MTLKNQSITDLVGMLNIDEFAEEITYIPSAGASRTINAIIDRQRVSPEGEDSGRAVASQVEIVIANDAVDGLSVIQKGVDKFSFPAVVGGNAVTWMVQDILDQDAAMWHLLLQK